VSLLDATPSRPARAGQPAPLVPAVARAVALLDRLAQQRRPQTMTRLAADLGLPKSSVHGLCNTLLALGYLRRLDDGSLAIGARVMSLAEAFLASTDVVREFEALWRDEPPAETAVLTMLDGAEVVYLAVRPGTQPLTLSFTRGMRLPAHLAATGRAMLAALDPAAARARLGGGALAALTPRSLTDRSALADELAATRARGYSTDDEGLRLGVYGLGAAVLDAAGRPIAGVGICLNKTALEPGELARQTQRVIDAAAELSRRLGGSSALAPATPISPTANAA